jgi:hypothetical protein
VSISGFLTIPKEIERIFSRLNHELRRSAQKMNKTMAGVALAAVIFTFGAQAQDGREGPIEIAKCQTISQPGSYKLVSNLTSTGDCLVITADFVTVDLAGFTITGKGSPVDPGTGILAAPSSGRVAVRNGSISGFEAGVDFKSATGSIVEGLRVSISTENSVGIVASGIVKGNTVDAGFGDGISATGIVTGNIVGGGRSGIGVGKGSTVIGNTATGAARFGLIVECPSNLTDNTSVDNAFNLELIGEGCTNTNNVAP